MGTGETHCGRVAWACGFLSSIGQEGKVSMELQMGKAVGNSDVWFRFNEGVSNAVRRNVYIKDLL